MADLWANIPPAFPPVVLLLLLFVAKAATTKKNDDANGEPARQSRSQRRILLLLTVILPMVPLAVVSVADSLRFRDILGASPVFGSGGPLPAILPPSSDDRYEEVKQSLVSLNKSGGASNMERALHGDNRALVTGASSGIGRAIAVQLARRGIPLILVARGGRNRRNPTSSPSTDDNSAAFQPDELDTLATDLQSCYGVAVSTIRADLSLPGESRRIHAATRAANLTVTYLILAAGWGPTANHVDLAGDTDAVERAIRVNVESTAALSSLYGADMATWAEANKEASCSSSHTGSADIPGPRMLIVSSIMGIGPGLPGASLYAATKAFGISLAQGLALEMEPLGVGVTVLCPGATRTNFGSNSGMGDAALWNFPLTVMDADDVAEEGVRAMFGGSIKHVPGFMNRLTLHVAVPLVPVRMAMRFFRFCWDPWPFSFPPGWRPNSLAAEVGTKADGSPRGDTGDSAEKTNVCTSKDDDQIAAAACSVKTEWRAQTEQPLENVGLSERVLAVEEAQ